MAKKVKGFEDFNIEGEKEKLQKIKRSFTPNSDQQQYTTNTRNEFDEDTRKITAVTKDEVEDKLKSLDDFSDDEINEAKFFTADPSIIKKYAARVIPLYITGELPCKETRLIDEWLEMNKSNQKHQNENNVCDLEIMAVKAILGQSPLTQNGYNTLVNEIDNRCTRLERFLRNYIQKEKW